MWGREIEFAEIREEMKGGDRWLRAAYAHGFMHGMAAAVLVTVVLATLQAVLTAPAPVSGLAAIAASRRGRHRQIRRWPIAWGRAGGPRQIRRYRIST